MSTGGDWQTDPEWIEFVRHHREHSIKAMSESSIVMHLAPPGEMTWDNFDVKYALELGASILMGKPILVVAMRDRDIPPKLFAVADAIVTDIDLDTQAGQDRIAYAIKSLIDE